MVSGDTPIILSAIILRLIQRLGTLWNVKFLCAAIKSRWWKGGSKRDIQPVLWIIFPRGRLCYASHRVTELAILMHSNWVMSIPCLDLPVFAAPIYRPQIHVCQLICSAKINSYFRYSPTCFGYEGKTGKEFNLIVFKGKPNNNHFIERSRRDIFIDMNVWKNVLKNNLITLLSRFTFILETCIGIAWTGYIFFYRVCPKTGQKHLWEQPIIICA